MKLSRIGQLIVGVSCLIGSIGVSGASAAKISKPGQPKIVAITAKKTSSKLVNITFRIQLPASDGGSPIVETVISGGGKSCKIKKVATSCVIKNVSLTSIFSYSATSKNKVGIGRASSKVRFSGKSGQWAIAGYTGNREQFGTPSVTSLGQYVRVLATQSTKWTRFQSLRRGNVASARVRKMHTSAVGPSDLLFLTTDVIALAIPENRGSTSGLLAITSTGVATDALISGTARISNFYSGTGDKYYVTFELAVPLVSNGPKCLLAEVSTITGIPTCVDTTLSTIRWSLGNLTGTGNPPIQLDNSGNIFYVGGASNGKTVLRKYSNGIISDLVNDNISISDFVVLGDSTVIVSGSTVSTSANWVRKISALGSVSTLAAGASPYFVRIFADGNVYLGLWGGTHWGVRKYNVATGAVEAKFWIVSRTMGGITEPIDNDSSAFCSGSLLQSNYGFCGYVGSMIATSFNVGTTNTFAITGPKGAASTRLMQYFPNLDSTNTTIGSLTMGMAVGTKLVLVGLNPRTLNAMSVYDTVSKQETYLLDGTNEIEVYNMTYVPSTNRVMFNGLRFADNSYIVGEVQMP